MGKNDFASNFEIPKKGFQIVQQTRTQAQRKHNVLYLPCRPLEPSEICTHDFQNLLKSMHQRMVDSSGIGIAANQVGKSLQVFIIEAESDNPRYAVLGAVPFQVFINPKILSASSTLYNFWHGCLSAEGEKRGNVAAYEWIEYECLDEKGELKQGKLQGLAAVIFQHEFRHLLGGTYLDCARSFLTKDELDSALERGEEKFYEITPAAKLPHLIGDYHVGDTLNESYQKNTRL